MSMDDEHIEVLRLRSTARSALPEHVQQKLRDETPTCSVCLESCSARKEDMRLCVVRYPDFNLCKRLWNTEMIWK